VTDAGVTDSGVGTYRRSFTTRWMDNDVYGHINNAVYYSAMDTTINTWLIEVGGLDIEGGDVLGVCVSSGCEYRASASYPDSLVLDVTVAKLGTTSVTWAVRIAREKDDLELAAGRFVHVFIDRNDRRPVPIPATMRAAISSAFAVSA
jgi:acyl-CoA thioester hydrolase